MIRQKEYLIKELVIATLIFIIFFLVYLGRSRYDLTLWDEGYNVYTAERVYDGQIPYRDFHVIYAPGRFFIQALMFKIFGVTLAVERAYSVIVIALFAVISYLLGRQLKISRWLSIWLTILVSHNSTSIFITPSIDRILGSFIVILGMILYDKTEKKIWLIVTGFLCTMNILIGQETGAYTLVALIAFFCWRVFILPQKKLPIYLFIYGLFIGAIPFGVYMISHGIIGQTVQDLLITPAIAHKSGLLSSIRMIRYFFNTTHLRFLIFSHRFLLAVIVPIGTLFFLFGKMVFGKEKIAREDGYLLMLSFFSILLVVTLPFTPHHLLMSLPSIYIMSMLFFQKGWSYLSMNKLYKVSSGIFILYLGLHFGVTTRSTLNSYISPFRTSCWKLELPRAKILISSHNTIGPDQRAFPFKSQKEIKELINQIQAVTPNGEPIFIVSQDAMLYFLADRDNPTGYDLINTFYINHQKNMISDLENKRVEYVILSNVLDSPNYTYKAAIRNDFPNLYDYIIRRYKFEMEIGFYEFWKKIK